MNLENLNSILLQENDLENFVLDMLKYLDLYILVLDEEMRIKFCSNKLQNDLGMNEEDMLNRCWLDFIKPDEHNMITHVHGKISNGDNLKQYHEAVNDIVTVNGDIIKTRWFNAQINHTVKWSFSFGLPMQTDWNQNQSLESIRKHYKDVINQDRKVIESVRNVILKNVERDKVCQPKT